MSGNLGSIGDQGENWAKTQFTDSNIFRVDNFSEEKIHTGWDIKAKLLDRDTGAELYDILFIQVKNYTLSFSNGDAILDNAIKVWHLRQWESTQSPTLIIAYDRNENWNPNESGYWIWHYQIINQIKKRDSNWRKKRDKSTVRVRIPVANKLTPEGLNLIYKTVSNHYSQLRQKIATEEQASLEPQVQNIINNSGNIIEYPEGIVNAFVVDIFRQILSEYNGNELISKVCDEIRFSETNHKNLEFIMWSKRLSIPYNAILKNSTAWIIHTFGSSIVYGELNTAFELILNSSSVEKKNDLDFSRESIISVFKSLDFKPTYILASNDLFVKWMEFFSDRMFFGEKQIFMKFENEEIPIIFVINELSNRKVLFIKKNSIESIVKYAEDTNPIINFQNDIPIGPREEKLDIRIRSEGGNIEFVFRTVRSFNLVEPSGMLLIDFSEILD